MRHPYQPGEEAEQVEYIRGWARSGRFHRSGANDELMLRIAPGYLRAFEGAVTALLSADLIVPDILSALELIENPALIATLRK